MSWAAGFVPNTSQSYICLPVLALASIVACAKPQPVLYSRSPDGRAIVTIAEVPHPPDSSLRVELSHDGKATTIHSESRDRWLRLIEVYWSEDSRRFGMLVCDPLAANVLLSYDLKLRRSLRDDEFKEHIKRIIVTRYDLSADVLKRYNGDAIVWACDDNSGAYARFRRMRSASLELPPYVRKPASAGGRAADQ